MSRGFGVAKGFEEKEINLPVRSTKNSAGYDFESAETVTIPSIWGIFLRSLVFKAKTVVNEFVGGPTVEINKDTEPKLMKPTLVKTGVKAYMGTEEGLFLYNRSSNPLKKFLLLANGVGVVDSDYYENPDNDGHIMFQFINFGLFATTIEKGDKIGQGIFQPFLKAENDKAEGERVGGHGSTGN
jgi:dUTP pyrophosphatase